MLWVPRPPRPEGSPARLELAAEGESLPGAMHRNDRGSQETWADP